MQGSAAQRSGHFLLGFQHGEGLNSQKVTLEVEMGAPVITLACSTLTETATHNYLSPEKSQHREPRDNPTTSLIQDSHDHGCLRFLLCSSTLKLQ